MEVKIKERTALFKYSRLREGDRLRKQREIKKKEKERERELNRVR